MFEQLTPPEPDAIIRIMGLYAADPRPEKIDLGVGVYRDGQGRTPIMAAVVEAEARVAATQVTKGYLGLAGDPAFHRAIGDLILGDAGAGLHLAACATPGGTGAVRQAFEMMSLLRPGARIWLPDPTWPNHIAVADHLGLTRAPYRYYNPATGAVDLAGMLADLSRAGRGDAVVLHACCHNPTGADLPPEGWDQVAEVLGEVGAIPLIDMAYLGLGDGLDPDAAGTRMLVHRLPEVLITASGSKSFGLYRERVGLVLAKAARAEDAATVQATLAHLNRQSFAFPPDHGARVVTTILEDGALSKAWQDELAVMRQVLATNRARFIQAMRAETGTDRFDFIGQHRGMFSLIGATPEQVLRLREEHALYMVGDGRVNVAGLTAEATPRVARAVAEVLG